jgi:hypothetical protein
VSAIKNRIVAALDTVEEWGRRGAITPDGLWGALRREYPDLPTVAGPWWEPQVTQAYALGARHRSAFCIPAGVLEGFQCRVNGCTGTWRRVPETEIESGFHQLGCVTVRCAACGQETADFWTPNPWTVD